MAKKKQVSPDDVFCVVKDYRGYLTSVPLSKLDAWRKRQEELRRNPPEEPEAEITPEMLDKMIEEMGGLFEEDSSLL